MKRKFYKVVKENLLSKKDLFIFTILESVNDLDIGKKILKVDNEFIFEDERDREKYKEIIEEIENGEYELLEILTHKQYERDCYRLEEE